MEYANLILVFGFFLSVFYGARAAWIFMYPHPENPPRKTTKSWWIHQMWINFWGSFIGWICVYLLVFNLKDNVTLISQNFSFGLLSLFVVGVLGTMGFLPLTAWLLANSIAVLTRKITGVKFEDVDKSSPKS